MRFYALALSALALLAVTCDRSILVNSKVLKSNQKMYNWDASEGVWKFAANNTQPINLVPVDFEPLLGDLLPSQLLSSLRPGVPPAFINERSVLLVTQCGRLAERVWMDGPGWKWQYHGFLPGSNSTVMRVYPHGLVLTAGGSFGSTIFQHFPEMQSPPSSALSNTAVFASSPEPAVWVGGLSYMLSNGSCMPIGDSYPSSSTLNQSPTTFQPNIDDLLARYPNLWLWSRRELDPGHVILSIGPQFSSHSFLLLTANQTLLFVSSAPGQGGEGATLEPYAYVTVPPEFPLRFISDFVNWNFIFALTLDGRFVEINMNFNEALPAIIQIFDYDKPKPGVSITSDIAVLPGMMSPLFMMCKDGHLYERNHQCNAATAAPQSAAGVGCQWQWYDHFSPAGVKLNPLLKPTILHLHSIFVLDVDGQLHEHAKVDAQWVWYSHAHNKIKWASMGGVVHSRSFFLVSKGGQLYERHWNGKKWIFIPHAM